MIKLRLMQSKNNNSVVEVDEHENLPLGENDCRNHMHKARRLKIDRGDVEAKQYDRMCGEFYKVATLAADSDDKCNVVLGCIQDLLLKIVDKIVDDRSMCGSNQTVLVSSPKCVDDDAKMSKQSCLVRSSSAVEQKGRWTTNSSQFNIEQVVRKLKSSRKRNNGSSPDQEEAMPSSHTPHIVDLIGTQESLTLMGQPPSYFLGRNCMLAPHVSVQSQPVEVAAEHIWMAGSGSKDVIKVWITQPNKDQ